MTCSEGNVGIDLKNPALIQESNPVGHHWRGLLAASEGLSQGGTTAIDIFNHVAAIPKNELRIMYEQIFPHVEATQPLHEDKGKLHIDPQAA